MNVSQLDVILTSILGMLDSNLALTLSNIREFFLMFLVGNKLGRFKIENYQKSHKKRLIEMKSHIEVLYHN